MAIWKGPPAAIPLTRCCTSRCHLPHVSATQSLMYVLIILKFLAGTGKVFTPQNPQALPTAILQGSNTNGFDLHRATQRLATATGSSSSPGFVQHLAERAGCSRRRPAANTLQRATGNGRRLRTASSARSAEEGGGSGAGPFPGGCSAGAPCARGSRRRIGGLAWGRCSPGARPGGGIGAQTPLCPQRAGLPFAPPRPRPLPRPSPPRRPPAAVGATPLRPSVRQRHTHTIVPFKHLLFPPFHKNL